VSATAAAPGSALVLFDLDGTLTRHDTLLPYLAGFLLRHPAGALRLPRALAMLARFAVGGADRGELKSAWIRALLGGHSRAEIEAWTERFVPRLLRRGLRRDARAAIERHRRGGDRLVLLSASPDLYVPAIARALGFAESVSTGLKWDGDRLEGSLTTANRRGAEKARYVTTLRSRHPQLPIVAYANAASDLEHLALADRAALVNGGWRSRRAAARRAIACLRWR
jgi:phosphatidylglycerophosphatase C